MQDNRSSASPNRISPKPTNHQVYIFEYKQTRSKSKNHKQTPNKQNYNTPNNRQHTVKSSATQEQLAQINEQSHNSSSFSGIGPHQRDKIDKLMGVLKSKSIGKDQSQSGCDRIFKWLEKIDKKMWLRRQKIYVRYGFDNMKKASLLSNRLRIETITKKVELKGSLEMMESSEWRKQIESGSKNFQLNEELLNIVESQEMINKQSLKDNQDSRNSLSKNLQNITHSFQIKPFPQKLISNDLYIVSRKSDGEITTKPEIVSFKSDKNISIVREIPIVRTARSISSQAAGKAALVNAAKDTTLIGLKKRTSGQYGSKIVHELCIESLPSNLPENTHHQSQIQRQISKVSGNAFANKYGDRKEVKRQNRLMEGMANRQSKKIIFHYNGEKSPSDNYYFPMKITSPEIKQTQIIKQQPTQKQEDHQLQRSTSKSKIFFNYAANQKKQVQTVPINRVRAISNNVVTNSSFNSVIVQRANAQPILKNNDANVKVQNINLVEEPKRRCNSMPKITFSYGTKVQMFVNPEPLNKANVKNSPIFQLHQLQKASPVEQVKKQQSKQDPYLCKNIQIKNTIPMKIPAIIQVNPEKQIQSKPIMMVPGIDNNYHLPVLAAVFSPKQTTIIQKPHDKSKVSIPTLPNTSYYSNQQSHNGRTIKAEEYYGQQKQIVNQPNAPVVYRERVRSIDCAYGKQMTTPQNRQQILNILNLERQRARSCNMKINVVTRRDPIRI